MTVKIDGSTVGPYDGTIKLNNKALVEETDPTTSTRDMASISMVAAYILRSWRSKFLMMANLSKAKP